MQRAVCNRVHGNPLQRDTLGIPDLRVERLDDIRDHGGVGPDVKVQDAPEALAHGIRGHGCLLVRLP